MADFFHCYLLQLFCLRLNFSTAFSSNAVSICNSIGLSQVKRLEVSVRYLIHWQMDGLEISKALEGQVTCKYYKVSLDLSRIPSKGSK